MTTDKYKYVEDLIQKRDLRIRRPTTGYKGVNQDRRPNSPNRYRAQFSIEIGNQRVKLYLGTYDTPEEAYIARIRYIDSLK